MATEAATPRGVKRTNIFTNRIGPLPMWAWLAIVLTAVLAWAWYRNRNQSQSSNTANASQVPQFVNQTFTNVGPPVAPTDKDTDEGDEDETPGKPGKKKPPGKKPGGGGDDGGNDHKHHPKRPAPRRHPTHHKGGSPGVRGSVTTSGTMGSVSTSGAGRAYPGARAPSGPTGPAQRWP